MTTVKDNPWSCTLVTRFNAAYLSKATESNGRVITIFHSLSKFPPYNALQNYFIPLTWLLCKKMERNLEWNGGRSREGEGCDWYKCGWLHELSLCSLGDSSASERAPRMASAHWLSSEGSGKSGSGNKTVTFPSTTSAQASQSLRISGSQCGDTWQHGRGQLRLAQCVPVPSNWLFTTSTAHSWWWVQPCLPEKSCSHCIREWPLTSKHFVGNLQERSTYRK